MTQQANIYFAILKSTAMERIVFTISWSSAAPAELTRLVYNGDPVKLPDPCSGNGSVSVEFTAPPAAIRQFEWTLKFLNRTLKELVASASIGGAKAKALNEGVEKKNRWMGKAGVK